MVLKTKDRKTDVTPTASLFPLWSAHSTNSLSKLFFQL